MLDKCRAAPLDAWGFGSTLYSRVTMAAPKPMLKAEVKRREEMALVDIAATARYHAERLPTTSKWRGTLTSLAERLEPVDESAD
jgi:hypothetical protein